eukprot:s2755_g2.t3
MAIAEVAHGSSGRCLLSTAEVFHHILHRVGLSSAWLIGWEDKGREKSFKYQVLVSHFAHPDGLCGFGHHASHPLVGQRLLEGLFLHDVLQQIKGIYYDLPLLEALLEAIVSGESFSRSTKKKKAPARAADRGGILVFLPGWDDIDRLRKQLRCNGIFSDPNRYWILPLHSQIRLEQQREVFLKPPPGVRKIVLSTNIAETSVTIDDIEVVIDCGRAKETSYDAFLRVPTLNTSWADTKAQCTVLLLPDTAVMIRRGPVLLLLAASLEAALSAENITNDTADEILSAADQLNINTNSEGDLDTFLSAIFLNSMIARGCILAFSVLRVRFPIVYSHLQPESNKALAGEPSEPSVQTLQSRAWAIKAKLCDWVGYSINTSIEDAVDRAGLDAALLREYTWLAARVLGSIGIPMCLIAIPVTKTLGGNGDVDKLSRIEMAAVQDNHAWLFYAHAVVVWLVCFVVHYWLFSAQAKFLDLRVKWLTNLPAPRSTTVMVEDIPKEWRSDAKLKQFFGKIFSPEDVREAHVVQYADALAKAVSKREQLLAIKRQAEATMEKTGKEEMIRPTCCGSKVDALEYANDGLQGMDEDIVELLHKCRDSQEKDPAATGAHCGFVTFTGCGVWGFRAKVCPTFG